MSQQRLIGAPLVIGISNPDPEQDFAGQNRILEVSSMPRNKPAAEKILEGLRTVHHSTILEMNAESYRRKPALKRKRGKEG